MDISFVILTWNSEKYIKACLENIILEVEKNNLDYEIYIVDNGSNDKTVDIINTFMERFPGKIRPIYLDRNMGTTYPRNLALKKATGKYLCIMDSDVELGNATIYNSIKTLETESDVGIVAPKLIYPNGKLQKSTDNFPTLISKIIRFFFLKRIEKKERENNDYKGIFPVDYAISALWFFKKQLLEKVGLLDEEIFYSPEDVDYCLRVWKSGFKVVYNGEVASVHHTQEISRGFRLNKAFISHIKGLIYYFIKHRYFLRSPSFRTLKH